MSELAIKVGSRFGAPLVSGTSAAGFYGREIDGEIARLRSQVGKATQNWDNWEPQIAAAIATISADCSVPNWDGDQASPVTPEALNFARHVVKLFYCFVPSNTPAPDVVPEADGEVSLTWTRDRNRLFSVSVGAHDSLNYAGRLGGGVEPHDVARFDASDPSAIQQMASYVSQLFR